MWSRNIRQLATTATNRSKFATQDEYAWFLPVQTRWKVSKIMLLIKEALVLRKATTLTIYVYYIILKYVER